MYTYSEPFNVKSHRIKIKILQNFDLDWNIIYVKFSLSSNIFVSACYVVMFMRLLCIGLP